MALEKKSLNLDGYAQKGRKPTNPNEARLGKTIFQPESSNFISLNRGPHRR
jgi:hypothetical protein